MSRLVIVPLHGSALASSVAREVARNVDEDVTSEVASSIGGASDDADILIVLAVSERSGATTTRTWVHSRDQGASVALARAIQATAGGREQAVAAPLTELESVRGRASRAAVMLEIDLEPADAARMSTAIADGIARFLRGDVEDAPLDYDAPEEAALPGCLGDAEEDDGLDEPAAEGVSFDSEEIPADLAALVAYLAVPASAFLAHEATYFAALSEHLRRHGALAAGASVDRDTFRDAVRGFQSQRGLGNDGIPGEQTLWALQVDWAIANAIGVVRVPADVVPRSGGYDRFHVRADAVAGYETLRASVTGKGGVITSAEAIRPLKAEVTAARSSTSMHYSGLALDLATDTGMHDPAREAYIVEREDARWRVWCRAEAGEQRVLQAVTWKGGAVSVKAIEARVVDFTSLAESAGFRRIGPRSKFPGDYMSAEWWHFQADHLLTPFFSQFGIELVRLHGVDRLKASGGPWENRTRIFRRGGKLGWN